MNKAFVKLLSLLMCMLMIVPYIASCANSSGDSDNTDTTDTTEILDEQTSSESTTLVTTEESEADTSSDTTEESDTETTAEETVIVPEDSTETDVSLIKGGNFAYRIVRDNNASTNLKNKISELRSFLQDTTGKSVEYRAANALLDQSANNNDYEILIGKTIRAASKALASELPPRDYFIGVFGNKIIIIGGNDTATIAALEYFMTEILSDLDPEDADAKITLAKGYFYRHVYIGAGMTIGDVPVSEFAIKYLPGTIVDSDFANSIGKKINNAIGEYNGSNLSVKLISSTTEQQTSEILVGPVGYGYASEFYSMNSDPMSYSAKVVDGKLYICGGGEWAMNHVADHIVDNYISLGKSIPSDFEFSGTLYAKQLFELEEGANLRIMANNVWSRDNNNTTWANMGENCSALVRAEGFVTCYMAFKPDVINVQEMSKKMLGYILENFKNAGYNYAATETIKALNIIYNTETLTLVEHGYHIFTYGCDGSSKGYAWALFEHKATGERFVSLSTHFWWKSETAQAGSDEYRQRQANEAADKCLELAATYNCPVFIGGDFNARTSTVAMKNMINKGMMNAFGNALVSDNLGSHHPCGPDGFSRGSAGTNNEAIDHMFYCNLGDAVLNSFRRTQPYFFIKLSDHYPLYVDVTLK